MEARGGARANVVLQKCFLPLIISDPSMPARGGARNEGASLPELKRYCEILCRYWLRKLRSKRVLPLMRVILWFVPSIKAATLQGSVATSLELWCQATFHCAHPSTTTQRITDSLSVANRLTWIVGVRLRRSLPHSSRALCPLSVPQVRFIGVSYPHGTQY